MKWGVISLTASTGWAMAAAGMIQQPWALYVASAMGSMISDPDGMRESAQKWRLSEGSDMLGNFTTLNSQLDTMKQQLKDQGKWEGAAFESFEQVHTAFKDEVEKLKTGRDGTAQALDSTAGFYESVATACSIIAGGMLALGYYSIASNANPAAKLASEFVKATFGRVTTATVGTMLKKMGLAGIGLAGIMALSTGYAQSSGKLFPGLAATPDQMRTPGTLQYPKLTYDPNMGGLTQKTEMPKMGGGLPI